MSVCVRSKGSRLTLFGRMLCSSDSLGGGGGGVVILGSSWDDLSHVALLLVGPSCETKVETALPSAPVHSGSAVRAAAPWVSALPWRFF